MKKTKVLLIVYYKGYPNSEWDKQISKLAHKRDYGSGYSFYTNKRDIVFEIKNEAAAKKIQTQIKKLNIKGLTTEITHE